ncbi:MAG: hypothetical protein ACTSRU_16745 [Candidatus Hodarchaeales archaeon]
MVTLSSMSKLVTSRKLYIDSAAKKEVQRVVDYAESHVVSHSVLEAMVAGQVAPVGDKRGHVCTVPRNYRIVYSIEEQAIGLCRHLSVSLTQTKHVPGKAALNEILKLFGFDGDIRDCHVWVEELEHVNAVNFVQPLKWDRETSTIT